ncbi:unnamed protein product [Soboliphyme baturini]|uniref:Ovule protein n=1 Tax=Soboliphyme baturini TaxID=241478 RepID=A0A183J545_9BILA|nr:unnamed protein product [Soboliphyme baturini]
MLARPWMQSLTYQLPFSLRVRKGKVGREFLYHCHLINRIIFSHVQNGLVCRYCVLFSDEVTNDDFFEILYTSVSVPSPLVPLLTVA